MCCAFAPVQKMAWRGCDMITVWLVFRGRCDVYTSVLVLLLS